MTRPQGKPNALIARYAHDAILFVLLLVLTTLATTLVALPPYVAFAVSVLIQIAYEVFKHEVRGVVQDALSDESKVIRAYALMRDAVVANPKNSDVVKRLIAREEEHFHDEISRIRKGMFPISRTGDDLYTCQHRLIENAKNRIMSIHTAVESEDATRWDPDAYNSRTDSDFYKHIVLPCANVKSPKVNVKRRLFICVPAGVASPEYQATMGRIRSDQIAMGFQCRFIKEADARDLVDGGSLEDILITEKGAVTFEDTGWSAVAYQIVNKELLTEKERSFKALWDAAVEDFEAVR